MAEVSWCVFELIKLGTVAIFDELLACPVLLDCRVANASPLLTADVAKVVGGIDRIPGAVGAEVILAVRALR